MKNASDHLSIFLLPPNMDELENRIRNRNSEPEEVVQKRLSKAESELHMDEYDYSVCNTTPEQIAAEN